MEELKKRLDANPEAKKLLAEVLKALEWPEESRADNEWEEGYQQGVSETVGYIKQEFKQLGL